MKLAQDSFRIKCGIAIVLLALALLPLVDWTYVSGTFLSPIGTIRHTSWLERKQKIGPLGVSVAMIIAGVSLCFQFADDPPPRKDPWEDERNKNDQT